MTSSPPEAVLAARAAGTLGEAYYPAGPGRMLLLLGGTASRRDRDQLLWLLRALVGMEVDRPGAEGAADGQLVAARAERAGPTAGARDVGGERDRAQPGHQVTGDGDVGARVQRLLRLALGGHGHPALQTSLEVPCRAARGAGR